MSADEVARAMDDLDRQLRKEFRLVADVYLDLTNRRTESDEPRYDSSGNPHAEET